MKKSIYIIVVVGLILSINFAKENNKMIQDATLANVEALASGEFYTGSANKTETTSQYGPFYSEETHRLYYWICTETLCEGLGYITCNEDFNCSGTVDAV
ncbi:MAG: hypothetical protein J6C22_17245 [Bacteroides sp.]|nr:hypothetical protein [Bacteroides sp.]